MVGLPANGGLSLSRLRGRIAPMRRIVALWLVFQVAPLLLRADNGRDIEQRLESSLVGKLALVKSAPNTTTAGWTIPRALADRLDPNFPTYVRVEDLSVRKDKLILRAQELFYYKDTDGAVATAEGASYSVVFGFPDPTPTEDELRAAIGEILTLNAPTSRELIQSWPPAPDSRRWKKWQRPASEPSIQVVPGVYTIGSDITPPKCEDCVAPEYGQDVRSRRASGAVGMWVVVTERGSVASVQVAEASERSLVPLSVSTVYKWRMKPALRAGKSAPVVIWVEINYRIF